MYATFRICTENLNKEKILEECRAVLPGFTVYESIGYWKGQEEQALTIEVTIQDTQLNVVIIHTLAQSIKLLNTQETILVTSTPVHAVYL